MIDGWTPTHAAYNWQSQKWVPVRVLCGAPPEGYTFAQTRHGVRVTIPRGEVRELHEHPCWPPEPPFRIGRRQDGPSPHEQGFRQYVRQEVNAVLHDVLRRGYPLTLVELHSFKLRYGLNSYEQKLMLEAANDEALLDYVRTCQAQVGPELGPWDLPEHYHDALLNWLGPLMAARLQKRVRADEDHPGYAFRPGFSTGD